MSVTISICAWTRSADGDLQCFIPVLQHASCSSLSNGWDQPSSGLWSLCPRATAHVLHAQRREFLSHFGSNNCLHRWTSPGQHGIRRVTRLRPCLLGDHGGASPQQGSLCGSLKASPCLRIANAAFGVTTACYERHDSRGINHERAWNTGLPAQQSSTTRD